ncbi:hypothetical protein TcCL_ESM07199 [Trypanosoma cruzi]|nr:hypothetical protein TcCL_ESM07199 [Trypanosoma cruzi]
MPLLLSGESTEGSRFWDLTSRGSALVDRVDGALCVSATTAEASRRFSSGERENPPTRRAGGGGRCSEERFNGGPAMRECCLQGSRSTWDFYCTYFLLSVCWLVLLAGGCIGPCANVNVSASVCGLTVPEPLLTGRVITVAVTTTLVCYTVAGGATLSPATSCFGAL